MHYFIKKDLTSKFNNHIFQSFASKISTSILEAFFQTFQEF